MSEADKMFEDLGFVKMEDNEKVLTFMDNAGFDIQFWKKAKEFCKLVNFNEYAFISIEELKAINKKCEELGWM